jgi:hypothetical protein
MTKKSFLCLDLGRLDDLGAGRADDLSAGSSGSDSVRESYGRILNVCAYKARAPP